MTSAASVGVLLARMVACGSGDGENGAVRFATNPRETQRSMWSQVRADLVRLKAWQRLAVLAVAVTLCVSTAVGSDQALPAYAGVVLKPGDVLATTWSRVWEIDAGTGTATVLNPSQPLDTAIAVAAGPHGEVYVVDGRYPISDVVRESAILRLNPATGAFTVVTAGGFNSVSGLVTESTGALLVSDEGNARILRVAPGTGVRSTLSQGGKVQRPAGVALEADGSVLTTAVVSSGATDGPRQIVRIRAGTGIQEVVSAGGLLVYPRQISVGPDGSIFAADLGGNLSPARVVRVHPQSGVQSLVSQFDGDGAEVSSVAAAPSGILFVGGYLSLSHGVFRIDPATNQRTPLFTSNADGPFQSVAVVNVASEVSCSPRPRVTVTSSTLGNGRLQVSVGASGGGNTIRSISLGTVQNATVEAQPIITGADASFIVKRTAPGVVTLPFTVVDGCGEWKTFVGGGPNAF
jgi:streptogramin lyase